MHYSQNQAPKHNFPKNIIKVTYLEKHLETIFFHLQYFILFYLFFVLLRICFENKLFFQNKFELFLLLWKNIIYKSTMFNKL